jgi:hypothetical protein
MNQQLIAALADQRTAQLRESAALGRPARVRIQRESLRVRTGWTLVGIGLRMVARPNPGLARSS